MNRAERRAAARKEWKRKAIAELEQIVTDLETTKQRIEDLQAHEKALIARREVISWSCPHPPKYVLMIGFFERERKCTLCGKRIDHA
jgi:hypothetical protein